MTTKSCYITSIAIGLGSGMVVTATLAQVDQWVMGTALLAGLGTTGLVGGICLGSLLGTVAIGRWVIATLRGANVGR